MDAPAATSGPKYIRLLPYWAVLQTDLRQTLRGWVWRTWVLAALAAAVGYLLYRLGVYREAGIVQRASLVVGDLLRWTLLGSTLLVVVLTVGGIAGERGTLADSVLSRGISRYQYFLAKLHARLACVLLTFTVLMASVLIASHFLVHEDLSLDGSFVAVLALAALLAVVAAGGVSVGALAHNPVFGIGVFWLVLCATAFLLSLLPSNLPTPDRVLAKLPQILRGQYDWQSLGRMTGLAALTVVGVSLLGLVGFVRSDV